MGRYTILEDPKADAAVQEVLDRISGELVRLLGNNLQAIVLSGGYGRGEGGAYRVGSEYYLVNDLDLLAFVRNDLGQAKKRYEKYIEQLAHDWLTNGRGLMDIDVGLTHIRYYRLFVPNTVSYYEIANGHQVIYGDLNLKKVMPRIDPRRLPVYEGANYFRNRGSALLIPAVYFLTNGLEDPGKRENFQIEVQKACQAMGDACLLMMGRYHFSYRERLGRFRQIESKALGISNNLFERVTLLYEWGMTSKLISNFEWLGDREMIRKWFEVRETFGDFFLWYESMRLNHQFDEWDDYADHIEHHGAGEPAILKLRSLLRSIQSFTLGGRDKDAQKPSLQRSRRCLAIMPLLLFSLTPNLQIKSSMLASANKVLEQPVNDVNLSSWKQLVKTHLLAYYPNKVVQDALTPF